MKLNRDNYEEFFILYMDNELGSEERREVELFAEANPDLKAELAMLLQTRLAPDTNIVFENKGLLLASDESTINFANYEQWLLSYIDEELSVAQKMQLEEFIEEHPSLKTELAVLQQAKLQPETIVFPDKESLYRKEEKVKVIMIHWKRWVAAAVLLLAISTTAVIMVNKRGTDTTDPGVISKVGPVIKTNDKEDRQQKGQHAGVAQPEEPGLASADGKKIEPVKIAKEETNNANSSSENNSIALEKSKTNNSSVAEEGNTVLTKEKKGNGLPEPIDNPYVRISGDNLIAANTETPNFTSLTNSPEITAVRSVTPDVVVALNRRTATSDDEMYAEPDGKKNKLRGFFRKVTRTLEKRTNIKATDDQDRLLIAGLAIKLN